MNEKGLQALKEYRRKVESGEIERPKLKNPKEKWEENKKSLRASVNAFCWECIGESITEIRYCTAINCPLYHVRPYQEKEERE